MAIALWLVWAGVGAAGCGLAEPPPEEGGNGPGVEVRAEVLAKSQGGREISIIGLHARGRAADGPAILVIAGVDPRHRGSPEMARQIGERLRTEHAAALARGDVYIVECLNPDGFEAWARPPLRDTARNPAPAGRIDADRDGRFNEDPPVDLDGDGRVLTMRVKYPPPGSGLTAEYVLEENDPRLLRRADRGKGERPVYALLAESKDADGDGLFGEDGFDGVELDRNFPYHWPEYRDEAGRVPLSEPESRAIVEWVVAHPNVVAVVEYAPGDNLVNVPPGGKMDETGEAPATNHVLDADRGVFERAGEKFREITGQKEAPTRDNDGTLQGWAYAQMGVWAFSTPGWVRPEAPKADDKKDEAKGEPKEGGKVEPASQPAAAEKPKPKQVDSSEGKWIAYSDLLVEQGKAAGFADWKTFEHPQLGTVEIGGFVPGFQTAIPADQLERVAKEQAAFLADVLEGAPRLLMRGPWVERLGDGVWRVRVEAVNEGRLPTRSAMGVKVRRLPPTRWTIEIARDRIVAGQRVQGEASVGPGATVGAEWTVLGSPGDRVAMKLISPECGEQVVEATLPEKKQEEKR